MSGSPCRDIKLFLIVTLYWVDSMPYTVNDSYSGPSTRGRVQSPGPTLAAVLSPLMQRLDCSAAFKRTAIRDDSSQRRIYP